MNHFKRLEKIYLNANFNKYLYSNTEIIVEKNNAEIKMPIKVEYFHALNAIHGSVYFKMLDDAAFFAAQSIVEDYMLLTASFNINFKMPVSDNQAMKQLGNSVAVNVVREIGKEIQSHLKLYQELI